VYTIPARVTPKGPLVDDLGTVVGRAVGPMDAEATRRLTAGEPPDPWRPPLAETSDRDVAVGGEARRIGYAWWKER
jgi:hypothetical protein